VRPTLPVVDSFCCLSLMRICCCFWKRALVNIVESSSFSAGPPSQIQVVCKDQQRLYLESVPGGRSPRHIGLLVGHGSADSTLRASPETLPQ
jgi:hypothetical protein